MSADVIVIGAGISGLCAARCLKERYNLDVLVLEARNRVGGRTLTEISSHGVCDLGGAYVGVTQRHIINLADELGIEFYEVHTKGFNVHYFLGRRKLISGVVPLRSSFLGTLDINNFWQVIDRMCKQDPLEAPWLAAEADLWDQMTVKQFIDNKCWTKYGHAAATAFVKSILNPGINQDDLSLLFFLWYLHGCGGVVRNFQPSKGEAKKLFKVVGGAQELCSKLMDKLGDDKMHFNCDVKHIDQTGDGVVVKCANGSQYRASCVISSFSPALENRITFVPALPEFRCQVSERISLGSTFKITTFYEKAFWKEKGLSGAFVCDCGPLQKGCDDTKPDGTHPAIMGSVILPSADSASHFTSLTREERKKMVCEQYAKIYDSPEALTPVEYLEKNWMEDEYAGGCYVGTFTPGVLTRYGKALRQPFGRVHFAGTLSATSCRWFGYIEAAIESGERATYEVARSLGKIPEDELAFLLSQRHNPDFPFKDFTFKQKYLIPSVPGFLAEIFVLGICCVVGIITIASTVKL